MIQFLLDAQLSRQLAVHLAREGYGASHVFDHLDPQADDLAIAALANQLGACVVSKDSDFARLVARGVLERPLVWIRVPNLSNAATWQRIQQALPAIVSAVRNGQPVVEVL